jgi:ABC-type uncharacterized transport system permease subunit
MIAATLKKFWVLLPITASLLFIVLLLVLFGAEPGEAFQAIWNGAFGTQEKVLSTTAFWVPLLLASTGLLVTF